MPLSRPEQETLVRIGFYDEVCSITTSNPTHARRLIKAGLTPSISRIPSKWDEVEDDAGHVKRTVTEWEDATWSFTAPRNWFKLPKAPRKMSEAAKQAAGERLRMARVQDDDDDE